MPENKDSLVILIVTFGMVVCKLWPPVRAEFSVSRGAVWGCGAAGG